MIVAIGSDHGGFEVKEAVKRILETRGVTVEDVGAFDASPTDYPDFGKEVAARVSTGKADEGVLVCTTGIGMSIAANRFPCVRAALCLSAAMAATARTHNNANVLVLAAAYSDTDMVEAILEQWLSNRFEDEGRHARRVRKLEAAGTAPCDFDCVAAQDPDMYAALAHHVEQEATTINLIASENYASRAVREAQASAMQNKYAEGYPGKRYYNGCEPVNDAENLAIERAKALFGAEHANVQPHSGSGANMAAYFALLEPGDTILAMSLAHGGHLTHGLDVNFSGKSFNFVSYGVSQESECLDYDELAAIAKREKPKLIVAGATAYPRILDFERFRSIADDVGALLMVDMAHIAGLVVGGVHPDPVRYAEVVTSTTHKTLRGPRSGMILCREAQATAIDRQIFPGLQGGPLMHTIAAKAVCFQEALRPEFKDYARAIVENARALAEALKRSDLRLVSGGTDNHLMLVDLAPLDITGKAAAAAFERAGIIANKNSIPFDTKSPFVTSGIRLGTPAATTRGMGSSEMKTIAGWIRKVLDRVEDEAAQESIRAEVAELAAQFPVP